MSLSADVALNRIMKAAVTRLARIARTADNQRRLRELAFAYADIARRAGLGAPLGIRSPSTAPTPAGGNC